MAWTLYRAGEFHTAEFPEPLWLAEPIIPYGGIAILHGPKTAGKTQLALTLAAAVANGFFFLDEFRCSQGGVLFIEADMPRRLLQDHMKKAEATKALWVAYTEPFDVVKIARNSLPIALQEAQTEPLKLVIVDSLRKTSRLEEQDSASPSLVYTAWKTIFPDATILIIHHDRKRPQNPKAAIHPEEAARGSGAWLDDADAGLRLTKARGGPAGEHRAWLNYSKYRDEEPPSMLLRMSPETLFLAPTKPTSRQSLWSWRREHPRAPEKDCRAYLVDNKICGQSRAYQLVAEAFSGGK